MIAVSLFLLFHLCIIIAADDHPQCEGSMLDWWNNEVQPGQRGYVLEVMEEHGGMEFHCLSKGENSEVMDPVVSNRAIRGMFTQVSKMPCKFAADMKASYDDPPPSNETTAACGVFDSDGCSYPKESEGQEDWGGPTLKISMVNDFHTTVDEDDPGKAYEAPFNNVYSTFSHGGIFGTPGTYCQYNDNTFLYSASMSLSTQTLDNMKYKVFAFSSEEQRLAALNDTNNEGLQYATKMKGENGCDVEILYEFKPQSGGGLRVNPSLTYSESERSLLDSSSAYIIEEDAIAIMSVDKTLVRESQHLPPQECDNGTLNTLKFSTQFVCKSTGQKVNITSIKYKGADGHEVDISADPNSPTYFQDPNNYIADPDNAPDLFLSIDELDAPESCGWMYWDPLVANMPGNGQGAQYKLAPSYIWIILTISVVVVVLGSIAYYRHTRNKPKIYEDSGSIEASHNYQKASSEADPEGGLEADTSKVARVD